jgi:glycosyltransferase involved in cell wall biosynthesis
MNSMLDFSTAEPVRILRVIARLNVGGPAIHVILVTEGLRAKGYDTTLACGPVRPPEGDMMDLARRQGVQPVVLPELGRAPHPLRDLVSLWRLWRLMRRVRPDIVHTHTAKAGFVGRRAARLAGVPVLVHTPHGHVFYGYYGPLLSRSFVLLERWAAGFTDRLVALTGADAEEHNRLGVAGPEKIAVIHSGVDFSAFARASSNRWAGRQPSA